MSIRGRITARLGEIEGGLDRYLALRAAGTQRAGGKGMIEPAEDGRYSVEVGGTVRDVADVAEGLALLAEQHHIDSRLTDIDAGYNGLAPAGMDAAEQAAAEAEALDTDKYGPYPTREERSREAGWGAGSRPQWELDAEQAETAGHELAARMTAREVGPGYLAADREAGQ
jgi:hypothetical protein